MSDREWKSYCKEVSKDMEAVRKRVRLIVHWQLELTEWVKKYV